MNLFLTIGNITSILSGLAAAASVVYAIWKVRKIRDDAERSLNTQVAIMQTKIGQPCSHHQSVVQDQHELMLLVSGKVGNIEKSVAVMVEKLDGICKQQDRHENEIFRLWDHYDKVKGEMKN